MVVIGAGPAGSTAAYRLAAAGARVVMLDKARFPRDKPCGGGITWRGVKLLGLLFSMSGRVLKNVTWNPRSSPRAVFSQPVTYHHSCR